MGRLKDFFTTARAKDVADEVNSYDRLGLTPLMHAVIDGDGKKVFELLDKGAVVNLVSQPKTILGVAENVDYPQKITALHLVAFYPDPVIADLLLKNKADVNVKDATGHSPFDYAILMYKHFGSEKYRRDFTSIITAPFVDKKAKMETAESHAEAVIERFIQAGAEPNRIRVPDSVEKKRQKFLDEKKQQQKPPAGPSLPL